MNCTGRGQMTEYVTIADALFFHKHLIERYGGAAGVRDAGALESALHRPQTGYYDTVVHEAAALFESLVQNHPLWTATRESLLPWWMSSCESTVIRLPRSQRRSTNS